MLKVHREVFTTTSERKTGFESGEDDLDLKDKKAQKYLYQNSKDKTFGVLDEGSDLENWNSSFMGNQSESKQKNVFNRASSAKSSAYHNASASLYNTGNVKSNTMTYQDTSRKEGLCTCCPMGYHINQELLKSINLEEYENVVKDPNYLIRNHQRLHELQQQQFRQQSTLASQSTSNMRRPLTPQQPFQQYPQLSPRSVSPFQARFSASTSNLQKQQQKSHQNEQYSYQQQKQNVYNQQQRHSQQSAENALMLYKRAGGGAAARKYSGDFYQSSGGLGNDVNRQEYTYVSEDGSTTTKVIEEIHKTRTTIIDLDSDTEEPVKNVEKVSQRQKTLNELQNKLKRIKPVGQQGSLKTYVNAAEPKLVDEPIEPETKAPVKRPTYNKPEDEADGKQVCGLNEVPPLRVHEKELNTEETTEIRKKEIKTIFLTGLDDEANLPTINKPVSAPPIPKEMRSFGVGDGNVFDDEKKNFEIHEKELKTVYLGGAEKPPTRNVGILCKSAMRDVGMVHNTEDEKPLMKNIGVGVGEMPFNEGLEVAQRYQNDMRAPDGKDESYYTTSGFMQTSLSSFKGGLKGDQLKAYLDEYLKRTVHSVGTQCQFSNVDKGTDAARIGYELRSTGCSDDTIDVEVRPIREMKSVAIDNRPSLFHRCVGTDIVYKLDVGTNTRSQGLFLDKQVNTEPKHVGIAGTMTEQPKLYNQQSGTEIGMFFDLNFYKNSSSMTDDVDMYNKRVNTEDDTDYRIGYSNQQTHSEEIHEEPEKSSGYRKYIEETVCPGYLVSYTKTTRSRSRNDRSPGKYKKSVTESSSGSYNKVQKSSESSVSNQSFTKKILGLDKKSEVYEIDAGNRALGFSENLSRSGRNELSSSQYGNTFSDISSQLSKDQSFTTSFSSNERFNKGGKNSYYTEKTTNVNDVNKRLGENLRGSSAYQNDQQFITEFHYPESKSRQIVFEANRGLNQKNEAGVEIEFSAQGGEASIIKSNLANSFTSILPSFDEKNLTIKQIGGEYFHEAQEYNSLSSGEQKTGVKTVVKESYGPNNVKTIERQEINLETGEVLSTNVSQVYYEDLPNFNSISSQNLKHSMTFAESGIASEKFSADSELSTSCQIYADWLTGAVTMKQEDLDGAKVVLHKRWFGTVGSKNVSPHIVEGIMAYFRRFSSDLLKNAVNFTDANKNTVLHYAVSYGRLDVAAIILSCGHCDLDKQNDAGYTVAMLVCITTTVDSNNLSVIRDIFNASNLNAKSSDSSAQTALMLAASHQKDKMVELMLNKCDVNARNSQGTTALMLAAQKGDYEITKMLLSVSDIDVFAINKDGKTALDIAKELKHQFVVSNIEQKIKELNRK